MLEKLKKFADQAKEKAGPMAEQAKEKATELAGKAAPAVSQGIDKAAESIDKATKGRYTEQLDKVQGVVHQTAQKVGDKAAGTGTGTVAPPVTPVAHVGEPDAVVIPPTSPVTPAEPVVTPPFPTSETEPGIDSQTTFGDGSEDKPQL
jgi:hypothetical protein